MSPFIARLLMRNILKAMRKSWLGDLERLKPGDNS
jgi:hypothetical protein